MFFVSNLRSSFQAVGRGFDPRLPLHVFNDFPSTDRLVLRLCSVRFDQRSKILQTNQLRGAACAPFSVGNR
jgi:hypothetical protein